MELQVGSCAVIESSFAYCQLLDYLCVCFFLSVAGVDYEAAEDSLRLGSGEVNQCFNVDILDDNILEEPENFMVHLDLADGTSKDILLGDGCIDTEVIIIDMNGI